MIETESRSGACSGAGDVARFVVLGALLSGVFACATRRGHVSMAPPRVQGDEVARASLGTQGKRVLKAADALSAAGIQQFSSARDAAQARLALAIQDLPDPTDGGTAEDIPDLPSSGLSSALPAAPVTAPALGEYKALFGEQLRDLQDQAARVEDVRLRYAGDAMTNGVQSRLYLLSIDVYVEPDRQDYWSYLWRWLDLSHGFRNYMKDHDVEIAFVLPPIPDAAGPRGRGLLEVVSVQPAFEAVSSLDGLANRFTGAASLAYGLPGTAAQLDLLRESEQQFAEIRRHPQVRGHVVSPTEFRFTISPRRRIVERGWFASLFTSRTKVERRLEAQTHTLQATLVVRNAEDLRDFSAKDLNDRKEVARLHAVRVNKLRPEYLFGIVGYERSVPDEDALAYERVLEQKIAGLASVGSSPKAGHRKAIDEMAKRLLVGGKAGRVDLPIVTYATYHELEDPHKPFLLPFDGRAAYPEPLSTVRPTGDTERDVRVFRVDLDLGLTGPTPPALTAVPFGGGPAGESWYQLDWPGHRLHAAESTLYESRGGPPFATSSSKLKLELRLGDSRAVFRLVPPPEAPEPGKPLALYVRVREGGAEAAADLPAYDGPYTTKPKATPPLDPASGTAGTLVHVVVPEMARDGVIASIGEIRFGGVAAAGAPFAKSADGKAWTTDVVAPPNTPYPVVDVTVTAGIAVKKPDGSVETRIVTLPIAKFAYTYWVPPHP